MIKHCHRENFLNKVCCLLQAYNCAAFRSHATGTVSKVYDHTWNPSVLPLLRQFVFRVVSDRGDRDLVSSRVLKTTVSSPLTMWKCWVSFKKHCHVSEKLKTVKWWICRAKKITDLSAWCPGAVSGVLGSHGVLWWFQETSRSPAVR